MHSNATFPINRKQYGRAALELGTHTATLARLAGYTEIEICRTSVHLAILTLSMKSKGFLKIKFRAGAHTSFVLVNPEFIHSTGMLCYV